MILDKDLLPTINFLGAIFSLDYLYQEYG